MIFLTDVIIRLRGRTSRSGGPRPSQQRILELAQPKTGEPLAKARALDGGLRGSTGGSGSVIDGAGRLE